jgi:hypothetical protein
VQTELLPFLLRDLQSHLFLSFLEERKKSWLYIRAVLCGSLEILNYSQDPHSQVKHYLVILSLVLTVLAGVEVKKKCWNKSGNSHMFFIHHLINHKVNIVSETMLLYCRVILLYSPSY